MAAGFARDTGVKVRVVQGGDVGIEYLGFGIDCQSRRFGDRRQATQHTKHGVYHDEQLRTVYLWQVGNLDQF